MIHRSGHDRFQSSARRRRQRGVTLIELMVALTIAAILTAGAVQIFRSARGGFRTNEALSRVQENGRFALHFLTSDIRRAASGSGCAEDVDLNSTLNSDPNLDFEGLDVTGTDGGGINIITATGASDSVTLKSADSQTQLNLQNNMPNDSAAVPVSGGNDLEEGDVVMVTDCESADVFQITNFQGTALVHNAGSPPPAPGNSTQRLSQSYTTSAQVFRARQATYQLAVNADGEPVLQRSVNGDTDDLVDNVVDLQLMYGEDTDNDEVPNRYVTAAEVGDMNDVLAIRSRITLRSNEENITAEPVEVDFDGDGTTEPPGTGDNRLYKVFTATTAIRNRLP